MPEKPKPKNKPKQLGIFWATGHSLDRREVRAKRPVTDEALYDIKHEIFMHMFTHLQHDDKYPGTYRVIGEKFTYIIERRGIIITIHETDLKLMRERAIYHKRVDVDDPFEALQLFRSFQYRRDWYKRKKR